MEARLKNIRMSSRKMNIVAGLVRTQTVNYALENLKILPKKAAEFLYKVILSAASNAEHNFKKDQDNLFIKEIIINEGATLKRGRPVSRGRWNRILKRTCHITVFLDEINKKEETTKKVVKKETTKAIEEKKKSKPIKEVAEKSEKKVKSTKKKVTKTSTKKTL